MLFTLAFVVVVLIVPEQTYHSALILLLFLIYIIFISRQINRLRKKELKEIIASVQLIREEPSLPTEKITLNPNMKELEEELKRTHERLKNDIEYLRKLEKVRTEFLGNVSHELKTPIFAIQGYVETLLNGAIYDDKVNKHFLEKALNHISNLNNLVTDLIDISMIESGEMRLSFRYFDAQEYFSSIVEEFRQFAEGKDLSISLTAPAGNIQVYGDKAKIRHVMNNLINNAIKYTETGSISVILEDEGKSVLISVKDSGIGIPSEDLDRIFERFYRVDKDRSREVGGTGLGLAIVKHIVEAHGSKVAVESQPGTGSCFSFRLKK